MRRDRLPCASRIAYEFGKLLRFTAVGLVATAVHLVVAFVAYRIAGLGVWSANLSGFLVALSFSYLGHYYFSFASDRRHAETVLRFLTTALAAYFANIATVWLLTAGIGMPEDTALMLGIAVMPVTTFTLSRLWVY